MTYKAKVALCYEIRTKLSAQSEYHVEFLNIKPGDTSKTARLLEVNYNVSSYMAARNCIDLS